MAAEKGRGAKPETGSAPKNAQLGGTSKSHNKSDRADAQVIGYVEKNSREHIRVALDSYAGHDYLDIRVFVIGDDGGTPTKKGVTIRQDRIGDLSELLSRAQISARQSSDKSANLRTSDADVTPAHVGTGATLPGCEPCAI